jgi:hypothetical protein
VTSAPERPRPNRVVTNVPPEVVEYIKDRAAAEGKAEQAITRELVLAGYDSLAPTPSQEQA